jgi:hypothetical protein
MLYYVCEYEVTANGTTHLRDESVTEFPPHYSGDRAVPAQGYPGGKIVTSVIRINDADKSEYSDLIPTRRSW